MKTAFLFAAIVLLVHADSGVGGAGFPEYSAASILNPYSGTAGMYTLNGLVTISGSNLSFDTHHIGLDDISSGTLPKVLLGSGVRVLVNHIPAFLYDVTPTFIRFLIPSSLAPGPATVQVLNNSLAGPAVNINIDPVAPTLIPGDAGVIVAQHLDGTLVTPQSPGRRGELVVVYAIGLGATVPLFLPGQLPDRPASIADAAHFQLLLNGVTVDPKQMPYVGICPPYPPLFQINLFIPDNAPVDPTVQIGFPGFMSPSAGILPIR